MPFVCAYWAHSYLSPKYSLSRHVPGKPSLTSSDRLKCSLQDCCIMYRPRHGLLPSSFPLFISVLPHTLPSFTSSKSLLKYHFLQETIFHHPIENYFAQDIPHTLLSFTCLLTYFLLSTPHQDVHSPRAWIQVCLGHCCNLSI